MENQGFRVAKQRVLKEEQWEMKLEEDARASLYRGMSGDINQWI